MNVAGWILLGLAAIVLGIFVALGNRKPRWYRVYLANPEMSELHVCRTGWDRMWGSEEAGLMIFHDDKGKSIRVGKHWIIKLVED